MDTKLKSISRNSIPKFIAFIMVVILITTVIVQIVYTGFMGYNPESLIIKEYKDSNTTFSNEVQNALHMTYWLLGRDLVGNGSDRDLRENLNYMYYITDGENTFTNMAGYSKNDFAKNKDAFFSFENNNFEYGDNTNPNLVRWYPENGEDITMYVAFPDEYIKTQQDIWEMGRPIYKSTIIYSAAALMLIVYLIFVTGRKPGDDELHSNWVDRIYTEILVLSFVPLALVWFSVATEIGYSSAYNSNSAMSSSQIFYLYLLGATTAIVSILCGIILLALTRKIKGKRFIKGGLIYRFYAKITDFIRSFFDGRRFDKFPLTKSLQQRQIVFIIGSAILVFFTLLFLMIPPLFLIPPMLEFVLIYWYIKYNNSTYDQINKGFNESLEEQMKSERMKINLVTNVSHDLKTPLTSIISYVDLLSKEEDLSESARDYANILTEKSNRLKNIVADLFDLAKSTSGDINLDFETLDMKKLIQQTLGDMEDDIEKSGLQIKTKLPVNPVNIVSDGKKLYRVFQNVLDNALKYSLQGTRVFVELEDINGRAVVTIKNTAGYEMDFNPDEILQRFSRGDQARTTDGSGLGLSIAESFTNVCGGDLKLDIDGDMFKVIISFKLA